MSSEEERQREIARARARDIETLRTFVRSWRPIIGGSWKGAEEWARKFDREAGEVLANTGSTAARELSAADSALSRLEQIAVVVESISGREASARIAVLPPDQTLIFRTALREIYALAKETGPVRLRR